MSDPTLYFYDKQAWELEIHDGGYDACVTFAENLSGHKDEEDPCIAYYDAPENNICAMCKSNSLRMFVKVENPDQPGKYIQAVTCGSVRMPDRGADGAYTYMVPNSANEWDTFQQ